MEPSLNPAGESKADDRLAPPCWLVPSPRRGSAPTTEVWSDLPTPLPGLPPTRLDLAKPRLTQQPRPAWPVQWAGSEPPRVVQRPVPRPTTRTPTTGWKPFRAKSAPELPTLGGKPLPTWAATWEPVTGRQPLRGPPNPQSTNFGLQPLRTPLPPWTVAYG